MGVMRNGVPRCGGVTRCELWCDMECCNFRHGAMRNAIEMQNV